MFRIRGECPGGNDWCSGTQQVCCAQLCVGGCRKRALVEKTHYEVLLLYRPLLISFVKEREL